ncbi:MAG TPA: hypothetical protein VED20_02660 [Streptosporangiaceae bacterium]|nr:hypothetical protein [Streptosporangiaceae bacterium]
MAGRRPEHVVAPGIDEPGHAGRCDTDQLGAQPGRFYCIAGPALELQAQRHEEGGHDVEICDREADVVEASYM